ncbi:MAG: hypothetical protein ACLQVM_27565 [Terriglobia bacterium]
MTIERGKEKPLRVKPVWLAIILLYGILATTSLQLSSENQGAPKPTGTKSAAKATTLPQIWKSASTGKEYRVKIDGDRFTAEWLNIPPQAAKQGAYIRSECRRSGSRWIGTSRILLACALPDGKTKMCPMLLRFEVDFVSPDRITGGGEILRDFDCGSCEVRKTGWGPFNWAPKR